MKTFFPLLGALLFAASTVLHAHTPPSEERRAKMREAMKQAHQACEGRQGNERRDCLRAQLCAQAKDPAKCEARAKQRVALREKRMEARQKAAEACTGKRDEELKSCLREQHRMNRGTK